MVKIYGCSDDLVEIYGSSYQEDEIGCYQSDVILAFEDGTVIRCGYAKPGLGVWYIHIEREGTAERQLHICMDEDADPYSDVLEIDAEVVSHWVIDKGAAVPAQAFRGMDEKERDDAAFLSGVRYAACELLKALAVPGGAELQKLSDADDICAQAAEKIREQLSRSAKETPMDPEEEGILACPVCGSGEHLNNEDGNENRYCGQCGQRLMWGDGRKAEPSAGRMGP